MKYNLLEFKRAAPDKPESSDCRWYVTLDDTDKHERISCKKYEPNPGLGFFYYPRKWQAQKAFDTLKQSMIEAREAEVRFWQREVEELKKLELPDWIKQKDTAEYLKKIGK